MVHDKLGHVWSLASLCKEQKADHMKLSGAHAHCEDLTTVGETAHLDSPLTKMELSDGAEKIIEQFEAITPSDGEVRHNTTLIPFSHINALLAHHRSLR